MGIRTDIGQRVELVSMDSRFAEISIGLYRKDTADGPVALVHTYSTKPGGGDRIAFVEDAMRELGGLEPVAGGGLRFSCRSWHGAAAKRLFLEACKHDPATPLAARPAEVPDTRSEQVIRIEPLGRGAYRIDAVGATDEVPSRAPAITKALVKLGQLDPADDDETTVSFSCGQDHHALIALLLLRAQNLRAALREEEINASRGVLTAPSAQE
jgi:hypothetical protein